MSKTNNVTEELQEQKVVTSYDRKVQKRKEQEEKDRKETLRNRIITAVVLVVIVGVLASFPIRNYLAVNQTFITVDGEDVNRVEFEYFYCNALNNYYNNYGAYLSLLGVDFSSDLTTQMYSEDLSWYDYICELAVTSIQQEKAVTKAAKAAGFTYDTASEWEKFNALMSTQAATAGVTADEYYQLSYGTYATEARIKKLVEKSMYAEAYLDQMLGEFTPSDEEVQAYYEENKDYYDSVDYRLVQITAELGEEPTEAEIVKAMKAAKKEADAVKADIETEGDLREGYTKGYVNSYYADWLFDASRKAGDVTVVEDEVSHAYYVVQFVERYLSDSRTVDARVITVEGDAQQVLDEWAAGAATEESFIELFEKYSIDTYSTEGGLFEDLASYEVPTGAVDWIFAEERQAGDTFALTEETYSYALYYVGPGELEWKTDIIGLLQSESVTAFLNEVMEGSVVEDPNGILRYLTVAE